MSREYDDYIQEHKEGVKACLELLASNPSPIKNLTDNKINMIAFSHDQSKFNYEEYKAYDDYFYGEERTPEIEKAFDKAWLHHIHNNPHHWQYWILFEDEGGILKPKVLEMPEIYIIEMVADWGSFSYRKKDALELKDWYNAHKDKMLLHPNTKTTVEMLVNILIEKLSLKFLPSEV